MCNHRISVFNFCTYPKKKKKAKLLTKETREKLNRKTKTKIFDINILIIYRFRDFDEYFNFRSKKQGKRQRGSAKTLKRYKKTKWFAHTFYFFLFVCSFGVHTVTDIM